MRLIPKCGYAAVRLECFFADGCGDPSSWSSSAFNFDQRIGASQRAVDDRPAPLDHPLHRVCLSLDLLKLPLPHSLTSCLWASLGAFS
jgi:hypothetical protein